MGLLGLLKGKRRLEEKTSYEQKGREELVYAVNYNNNSSKIFLYLDGKNDILLGERWHKVSSLCVHNNWLYDGGYKFEIGGYFDYLDLGFVIDTITGKDIMKREGNPVYSLCSYNRKFYRGGKDGIFEVVTGKKIASRNDLVTALCSHEGILYDGGYYPGLYNSLEGKIVSGSKKINFNSLCSYKGVLYGGGHKIDKFYPPMVFDVFNKKKIFSVFAGDGSLQDLCACNNKLYGSHKIWGWHGKDYYSFHDENYCINSILEDPDYLLISKGIITAMCSIPSKLAEQIKHSNHYGFNLMDIQRVNPEGFMEYFNIQNETEQKETLKQLLNCDSVDTKIINWLEEHKKDVLRSVAFS